MFFKENLQFINCHIVNSVSSLEECETTQQMVKKNPEDLEKKFNIMVLFA